MSDSEETISVPAYCRLDCPLPEAFTVWIFGLSGAGKTVCAKELCSMIKRPVVLLDGNELRATVNRDLEFTIKDRTANVARTAHIAKILNSQGMMCVVSMVTPLRSMRTMVTNIISRPKCFFIYISTPLQACLARDPKRIYSNQVPYLSGLHQKFEVPSMEENVILNLDTSALSFEEMRAVLQGFVRQKIYLDSCGLLEETDGKKNNQTS